MVAMHDGRALRPAKQGRDILAPLADDLLRVAAVILGKAPRDDRAVWSRNVRSAGPAPKFT